MPSAQNRTKKRALITGITGQDGAYLADTLLKSGCAVYGLVRFNSSTEQLSRLKKMNILDRVNILAGDVTDISSLVRALQNISPHYVFNLAANTFVQRSWDEPIVTHEVTALGAINLFEALRITRCDARVFQASSSEMYGDNSSVPCHEDTSFSPVSPYGVAKLAAHAAAHCYNKSYGMRISCGIMFNHESPLRNTDFVTRKITTSVAAISLGLKTKLLLGNVKAVRDWTHAKEMTEAVWRMLQLNQSENIVLCSGYSASVEEFCEIAFRVVNLDYRKYVEIDNAMMRPRDIQMLRGDNSKARSILSWQPQVSLEEMVSEMVKCDVYALSS